MKKISTDPSVRLDIYSRPNRTFEKTFNVINSDGTDYDFTGITQSLIISKYGQEQLTLTEADGITVSTGQVAFFKSHDLFTLEGNFEYQWIWETATTKKTIANGRLISLNEVKDSFADSETITISLSGEEVTVTVEAGGGTVTDARIVGATIPGFVPVNELTYDKDKIGILQNGGTWSFTKASIGNKNGKTVSMLLNTPTSVAFSSDFVALDSTTPDIAKLVNIFSYYNSELDKAFYAVRNTTALDLTGPTFSSLTVSSDNSYADLVFDEGIYGAGEIALTAAALTLTFAQNGGAATNVVISSIKQNDSTTEGTATALAGGETTVRVFLTVTGEPDGNETITITPTDGASVYDVDENAMSAATTTGAVTLNNSTAVSDLLQVSAAWYNFTNKSVGTFTNFTEEKGNYTAATISGVTPPEYIAGTKLQFDRTLNHAISLGSTFSFLSSASDGFTIHMKFAPTDLSLAYFIGQSETTNQIILGLNSGKLQVLTKIGSSTLVTNETSAAVWSGSAPFSVKDIFIDVVKSTQEINIYVDDPNTAVAKTANNLIGDITNYAPTINWYLGGRNSLGSPDATNDISAEFQHVIINPKLLTSAEKQTIIDNA